MLEKLLGITGLHEILGRDYGIEEPYWGASKATIVLNAQVGEKAQKHPFQLIGLFEPANMRSVRFEC